MEEHLNRDGSSWVEPVLRWDKCVLLNASVRFEPAPLSLESSTLPLSHYAPYNADVVCLLVPKTWFSCDDSLL